MFDMNAIASSSRKVKIKCSRFDLRSYLTHIKSKLNIASNYNSLCGSKADCQACEILPDDDCQHPITPTSTPHPIPEPSSRHHLKTYVDRV